MAGNNDFLAFAIGVGANVLDQADYAVDPAVTVGFESGVAPSIKFNKVWRQSSVVAALIGHYISQANLNANDDGNIAGLAENFQLALQTYFAPCVVYPGDPNGNIAGIAANGSVPPMLCWDPVDMLLWVCIVTGDTLHAVWAQSGRQRLTSNTTIYVSSASGNDTNNGLTTGTAFKTLPRAAQFVQNIDFNGYTLTVDVITGVYTTGFSLSGSLAGAQSFENLVIATSGGPVVINGSGYCFQADLGAGFVINGNFTLNQTNASGSPNSCIIASNGARVGIGGTGLIFGNAQGAHMLAASGAVITNLPLGTYTVSGNMDIHWEAQTLGSIVIQEGATITLTGTPGFGDWAVCYDNSVIECAGLTFGGAGIGQKFNVFNGGLINTGGASVDYLPGNSAGFDGTATGGHYV
jgi:hypothetical protein